MTSIFAKAGIAALIVFCAIPATVSTAAAAGPHGAIVEAQYGGDRHYRPHRACSPIQAVQKARMRGLRDVRVTGISPRRVVVAGHSRHHGRDRIVFANVRGCPIIRR